jgi:hypothetical protein
MSVSFIKQQNTGRTGAIVIAEACPLSTQNKSDEHYMQVQRPCSEEKYTGGVSLRGRTVSCIQAQMDQV